MKFLRRLDREFPGATPLHLVIDNYGTHGTPEVKAWLKKHRRFVMHYVPTSCSWLNLIERWFAELTNKRIRRDSFFSVEDLVTAIEEFLATWNEKPRPFVFPQFCKGCGRCISACPKHCISMGTEINPQTGLTPTSRLPALSRTGR